MAQMDTSLQYMLEQLFDMSSGYVMDFSNASFASFVHNSIGVDAYEGREGLSKANILRGLWHDCSNEQVKKICLDLLERWRMQRWAENDDGSGGEWKIFGRAYEAVETLADDVESVNPDDIRFLEKDFEVDLTKVKVDLDMKQIVRHRLEEIDKCADASAPLAVIFLCGSTLEGLLYEVAFKNVSTFNKCTSAPKDRTGKTKPLQEWTLSNLIDTSRELGLVGEDVSKHAYAVRDFRNYIHPRQQLKENFAPRDFTASMARQVLNAALNDLSSKR